jgi:chromosomal replication initiation ATPase DnaA
MTTEFKKAHFIIDTVCAHFRVEKIDLTRKGKTVPFVIYRHMAMALIRKYTGLTLCETAKLFNLIHHTTTLHAVSATSILIEVYDEWRDHYFKIEDRIKEALLDKIAA